MSEAIKSQGTCSERLIEENKCLQSLQVDSDNGVSMDILKEDVDELNQKKVAVVKDLQFLQDRVSKANANHVVQNLMSCLKTLEDLGKQESELLSPCDAQRIKLQAEIFELEGRLTGDHECSNFLDSLDNFISESEEELNSVKKALASRLRETLALKRLLDDVPTQTELIQYERRFSELFINIQDKHRQTRRYYATYNALLEIKDLMLKETSLLNSISSQFQDAIANSMSQMKLIESMEGILKGIQQKLDKVLLSHQEEQQVCNALKEKYAAATAEQRRCYALLKAFQEECAKNEKLRTQTSP
ncbi:coiled-coil domain-containing protein 93 isoform X1 [Cucurbita pepo subsp. pepo]|uniref:coiled-coil domain-containing protein 93 isoform X1 n=1 Tax=Cucurbita pepo subsp. pepo TaxID=3664 RepID=UPI000C9D50F5|nr:coiled-coil domain-containing protein 93 isoform X1 [Cucurbita pepo subsp. pepo]XP_023547316.1 coiled-coil domain-containing protein 93 isoform X2 [Cucurbita pepo subsp. pepo]XP_023547318.1 coiled-coil domain-containing protein 93 isoform X1 [Cucurbita pepo subsp. pepo]